MDSPYLIDFFPPLTLSSPSLFLPIIHFPVTYRREGQMKPLNECLARFQRQRGYDETSAKWVMFHDTDEYVFPVDTSSSISDALRLYDSTCCLQVGHTLVHTPSAHTPCAVWRCLSFGSSFSRSSHLRPQCTCRGSSCGVLVPESWSTCIL